VLTHGKVFTEHTTKCLPCATLAPHDKGASRVNRTARRSRSGLSENFPPATCSPRTSRPPPRAAADEPPGNSPPHPVIADPPPASALLPPPPPLCPCRSAGRRHGGQRRPKLAAVRYWPLQNLLIRRPFAVLRPPPPAAPWPPPPTAPPWPVPPPCASASLCFG
jgi:hypothetical protein